MKKLDLKGQRFGKLKVLEEANQIGIRTRWICLCDCGNKKEIGTNELRQGNTQSCGCYQKECRISNVTKHKMSNTRLYKIWSCMKYRCLGRKYKEYHLYGGRGIKICDEWLTFDGFYEWAKDKYFENSSIDRINYNGNYEPSNCRFVDNFVQAKNRRNVKLYTYKGETLALSEWARKYNINYFSLRGRVKYSGWDIGKALTTPFVKGNNQFNT